MHGFSPISGINLHMHGLIFDGFLQTWQVEEKFLIQVAILVGE